MSLHTQVSVGEALDKLSILDIKMDLIKDSRREHVKVEFDVLSNQLQSFIEKQPQLYQLLKNINLVIWHEMDVLRDGELTDREYSKLCRKTVTDNDIRFRIKNKINLACQSILKEQKGYKKTQIVLNLLENNDFQTCYFIIQYYSVRYDETTVLTFNSIIQSKFEYDSSIVFLKENPVLIKSIIIPNQPINQILNLLRIEQEELKIYGCRNC